MRVKQADGSYKYFWGTPKAGREGDTLSKGGKPLYEMHAKGAHDVDADLGAVSADDAMFWIEVAIEVGTWIWEIAEAV